MFCYASQQFQMGLECLVPLGRGRWFLCGWLLRPREGEAQITLHGAGGRVLRVLYESYHLRPELPSGDRPDVLPLAFHIVFVAEREGRGQLVARARAMPAQLSARLGDPALGAELSVGLAGRPGRLNLILLDEARREPELLGPLLDREGVPLAGLRPWVEGLHALKGEGQHVGPFAEILVATGPGEELAIALRSGLPGAWPKAEGFRVAVFAEAEEGGPRAELVTLEPWLVEPAGPGLLAWGRLPAAWAEAAPRLQVVLALELAGRQLCVRCTPQRLGLAGLFDAAAACALGPNPDADRRMRLRGALTRLLEARENIVAPQLRAGLARQAPAAGAGLLLVLGVEDEMAVRLLEAVAPRLSGHRGPVLLRGAAAGEGVLALEAAGLPALAGAGADQRLREEGARSLRVLDLAVLAEAMVEDRLEVVLAAPAPSVRAGHALLLHRLAGLEGGIGATLARLAAGPAGEAEGLLRGWLCRDAAPLINAHLRRLWAVAEGRDG